MRANKILHFTIPALFVALAALISLVNHYCFHTYYFDLAWYSNALYNYIHFHKALFTTGDHFDFLLPLFSPLSLLLGTYTLPIIQIIALVWGGFGVKKYLSAQQLGNQIPLYGQAYFYLFYGTFTALAFDYHSNVVAAALVPHLLWALSVRRWFQVGLWFMLILIAKENMSLWLIFVLSGYLGQYLWKQWKTKQPYDRKFIRILTSLTFIATLYFFAVTRVFMPLFLNGISYTDELYSVLGNDLNEMIHTVFLHPFRIVQALFINHNHAEHGDYVKMELHFALFMSGAVVLWLRPQYLWMLLPIFAQKLFHDSPKFWGVGYHYSIEFAPILAIAIFEGIGKIKNRKRMAILCSIALIANLINTIHICDRTITYINRPTIRFYQVSHYTQTEFDIADAYKMMKNIPDTAAVSAQSLFTPHLSQRKHCYEYPDIPNHVSYVMICRETKQSHPISAKEWKSYSTLFLSNPADDWVLVDSARNLCLFQRK